MPEFSLLLLLHFWSVFISHYRACQNCYVFIQSALIPLVFLFYFVGGGLEISQNCVLMSAQVTESASGSHWSILTGQFQWWHQWQRQNVLPLKQNVCSTVGYPDSWYATLWLTWNHNSSDPFPFLCNFPSSSICFWFAEAKLFTLLFLWKHGISEGFVGSINHQNGCVVITST